MKNKRINGLNFGGALVVITILISLGLLLIFKSMDIFQENGRVAGVSDFKTVGSNELNDPEYYPVADSNFIAGLTTNNNEGVTDTPEVSTTIEPYTMNGLEPTGLVATRTDDFEIPYYGFTLTAESPEMLADIAFQIVKPDGSLSLLYMVETVDDNFDRDGNPVTTGISNQYLFKEGVKAIHFYYEGEKTFTVNRYAFENEAKAFTTTDVDLETAGITEFKTKLLSAGGLTIIPRSAYGAPPENNFAPGWIPPYYSVNRIVVHHTATSVDMANPANTVRAIWQNHSYTRDWGDIGYNYLIDPYGNIYDGRSGMTGIRGNHAPPNEGSIGISLLGDYTAQVPTQAALDSLAKLVAYLSELNDIPITWRTNYDGISPTDGIYPHRAFNDYVKAHYDNWAELVTACPGEAFMGILPTVMANAQNIKNANTTLPSIVNEYKQTIAKEDIMRSEGNTEILVDATKLTPALKTFLERPSRRFTFIKEIDGTLLYRVPDSMAKEFFVELNLTASEANPQPNYLYTLQSWDNTSPTRAIPSDYSLIGHWNLEKIYAPEAWKELGGCTSDNSCTGDSDVLIAVLDTGVAYEDYTYVVGSDQDRAYYQNPEFSNINFVGGFDSYQLLYCIYYGCTTEEAEKINHGNDDHGHGSSVTSVIAANISDTSPNKVLGIANNVSIMPVKISIPNDGDTGGGQSNTFLMAQAIDFARVNGADIVNISFGGDEYDSYIEEAVNEAYNAGMVIVGASGNSNGSVIYPAAFVNVIAVGASSETDQKASYSNYGPELDIVAPVGNGIYVSTLDCYRTSNCSSTNILNTFTSTSSPYSIAGTSFAAPQVAAAAGLIKSHRPTITNEQLTNRLLSYTTDIVTYGYDNYTGHGVLNVYDSLENDVSPVITSALPATGFTTGGTVVTLSGSGFQANGRIFFENVEASDIVYIDSTSVEVASPLGTAGTVDIKYVNPNSNEYVCSNCFEFLAPPRSSLSQRQVFNSYAWDASRSLQLVSGDFNNDGWEDTATMYNYGNNVMKLLVFENNGDNTFTAKIYFSSTAWNADRSLQLVSGDFNDDGRQDIGTMYNYGNNTMKLLVFENNGNSTFTGKIYFTSTSWNADRSPQLVSGDFNSDGFPDIGTMYNYGGTTMKLLVFENNGNNTFTGLIYFTSVSWDATRSPQLVAGDYNNDGLPDIGTMYNYGNNTMKLLSFDNNGNKSFTGRIYFTSTAWNADRSPQLVSGDFNGDLKTDIGTIYDYGINSGGITMGLMVFENNGNDTFTANRFYSSWVWDATKTPKLVSGKFTNNVNGDDLATLYNFGGTNAVLYVLY